ncbi:MAG: hypothetical protein COA58_15160 [Bacteroidetes bacterium]|nr:MAG: hypothetical protein COA58_15160 [Bacteroidota bacterium]
MEKSNPTIRDFTYVYILVQLEKELLKVGHYVLFSQRNWRKHIVYAGPIIINNFINQLTDNQHIRMNSVPLFHLLQCSKTLYSQTAVTFDDGSDIMFNLSGYTPKFLT